MSEVKSEIKFRPVRGTEQQILGYTYTDGAVYFAYDTKKIFMDCNGQNKLVMGGSGASIFYGKADNVVEQADTTFRIEIHDLEDESADSKIKPDDLILNKDGTFYRVVNIIDNYLYCNIIAVSGTGGGGGTGGGNTGTGGGASVSLTLNGSVPIQFIKGQPVFISHTASSTADGDDIITITYTIITSYGDSTSQSTYTERIANGSAHVFDIGSKLGIGTNSITVTAIGDNGGSTFKKYGNRTCVSMELKESDSFNPLNVFNGGFDFFCIPTGASTSFTQTLKVYIDGMLQPSLTKTGITSSGAIVSIKIPAQKHGRHTLKVVLSDTAETIQESLSYEIACSETGVDAPIIWLNTIPESVVNHSKLNILYRIYDPRSNNGQTTLERTLNGASLSSLEVSCKASESQWSVWSVTGYMVGKNFLTIGCGGVSASFMVEVERDSRDLDIISSGLILNLDAEGRSLDENKTDRATWEYTDVDGKTTPVTFKNFNWYNNGWKTDKDGYTCLRISNGASIQIPLSVFQVPSLASDSAYSFEFVFKLRNVKSYDSLIKTVATGRFDSEGNEIYAKQVTSTEGVWLNYYKSHVGFCLGTQECFFTGSNTTVSGRYMEDEVVHLTFVVENAGSTPLMYVYINGIASGIAVYAPGTEKFNNDGLKTLTINSDYCDVDLYKLRVYKINLTAENVVHNYIADYVDAKLYDANLICKYENGIPTIDYDLMVEYNKNNPDDILMPYMVLESPDGILPYYKDETSDGRSDFKITFKNPSLDRDWDNNVIQGLFDSTNTSTYNASLAAKWGTAENYYIHHAPSYECSAGVFLNVQGTSSQGYPRRNYKAKFKDAGKAGYWKYTEGPKKGEKFKKWFLDSNVGETSFCFKADYMESSRSHNTGFANFVDTFYTKHPLNDYGIDSTKSADYRTAIYGFPMMVFHKYNGKTEFIGMYNYNLDKSCKDSFGFTNSGKSHVKVTVKATEDTSINPLKDYYSMDDGKTLLSKVDKFEADTVYYEAVDEEGDNTFTLPIDLASATECWQIEHNRGDNCSFKNANFDSLSEDPKTLGIIKAAAEDFEVRYHPDKDNIEYAIEGKETFEGFQRDPINKFLKKKISRLEKMVTWVSNTDPDTATNEPLEETYIFTDGTEYTHDTPEYRLAKFSKEFEEHFDLEYCIVYYIATEILLCYDSRGKNCMLATWGPQVDGGHDIWYPIFYDIDTQLGINNSGVPYWDYYEEASNNKTFSTNDSVLWNNLWKTKKTAILSKYASLRGDKMSLEKIDGSYDFNPNVTGSYAMKGERPLIAINIDEYYKYIDPAVGKGYYDTSNKIQHTSTFFYCLQGTRQLQRRLFLRNRFNYMDSMWNAGTYSTTGIKIQVAMRFDANYFDETSDKWLYTTNPELINTTTADGFIYTDQYPMPLDTNLDFEITPYLKQYVHLQSDDTKTESKYTDAGVPVMVSAPSDVIEKIKTSKKYQQQLIYFGGIDYVSSLGDLSLKYLDQFQLTGGGKRLKDLILGNDADTYFNKKLVNGSAFALNDSAYNNDGTENESAKTLLETIILTNLTGLDGTVDLSGSEKLKTLRALNTSISSFVFAEGVQLETAYLPQTITDITLIEPTSLTNVLSDAHSYVEEEVSYSKTTVTADIWEKRKFYVINLEAEDGYSIDTAEEYNPATAYFIREVKDVTKYNKGLYVDGVTNLSVVNQLDTTNIQSINIRGGKMGYDSYKLLERIVDIKLAMIKNQNLDNQNYSRKLYAALEDINWSPFVLVESGEPYNQNLVYKKKTDHYTMVDYFYDENTWDTDTLNGLIYEYYEDVLEDNKNVITDLSLLDTFIADYEGEGDYPIVTVDKEVVSSPASNWFESITKFSDGRKTYPTLSGIIYVNNVGKAPIKESDIKNKYIDKYFNDLIIYAANVEESYIGKFVNVIDGKEEEVNIQKFQKTEYTNEAPIEAPDEPTRLNYDFVGWATDVAGKNMVPSSKDDDGNVIYDFSKFIFNGSHLDYKFYAIFKKTQFTITFKNNNEETIASIKVTYQDRLRDPGVYPISPRENELATLERYKFVGYSLDNSNASCYPDKNATVNPINLSEIVSDKNYIFYAIYQKESVYDSATDNKFFSFKRKPYQSVTGDSTITGYEISVNTYKNEDGETLDYILKGKITIPSEYKGEPVISIANSGFLGQNEITHIFFQKEGLQLKSIGEYAFMACSIMEYFDFCPSIEKILKYAFQNCKALNISNLGNATNLYEMDSYCINGIYGTKIPENDSSNYVTQEIDVTIPGSLVIAQANCISHNNFIIKTLTIGTPTASSKLAQVNNPMITDVRIKDLTIYSDLSRKDYFNALVADGNFGIISGNYSLEIVKEGN